MKPNDEKFLIRPVFYKEDENGAFSEEIGINELNTLSVNTKLKARLHCRESFNGVLSEI